MKKLICIKIDSEMVEEIDSMADKYHMNRSQFMRNLVDVGLLNAKALDAVGVLSIVSVGKDLTAGLLKAASSGKLKVEKGIVSFPAP